VRLWGLQQARGRGPQTRQWPVRAVISTARPFEACRINVRTKETIIKAPAAANAG